MKRRVSQIVIYLHGVLILQVLICISVILSGIKPAEHVYLLLTSVQDTGGTCLQGAAMESLPFPQTGDLSQGKLRSTNNYSNCAKFYL